jgi:DNA-binding CsgD family transcriptional regulator
MNHRYASNIIEKPIRVSMADKKQKRIRSRRYSVDIEPFLFLPANVFFQTRDNIGIACNDLTASMLGWRSRREYAGRTYREMAEAVNDQTGEYEKFRKDDLDVITSQKPKLSIVEPTLKHASGWDIQFVTNRIPIFDNDGIIAGTLGISFDIGNFEQIPHANALTKLLLSQFPNLAKQSSKVEKARTDFIRTILSKREKDCIYHLMLNKTAKESARLLGLSNRTVESYLDSAKNKLGCSSKSKLVEKALILGAL